MGYRSDVGIMCGEKAYHMFDDAIKKHDFMPDEIRKGRDSYFIKWSFVKWYEWYEDVAEIENVMRELDKICVDGEPEEYVYQFIRIGEDYGDVEEKSNGWLFNFYVTRDFAYFDNFGEGKVDTNKNVEV